MRERPVAGEESDEDARARKAMLDLAGDDDEEDSSDDSMLDGTTYGLVDIL